MPGENESRSILATAWRNFVSRCFIKTLGDLEEKVTDARNIFSLLEEESEQAELKSIESLDHTFRWMARTNREFREITRRGIYPEPFSSQLRSEFHILGHYFEGCMQATYLLAQNPQGPDSEKWKEFLRKELDGAAVDIRRTRLRFPDPIREDKGEEFTVAITTKGNLSSLSGDANVTFAFDLLSEFLFKIRCLLGATEKELTAEQLSPGQVSVSFIFEDKLDSLFPTVESQCDSSKVNVKEVATIAVSMAGGELQVHSAKTKRHTIQILVIPRNRSK
jgi:hypothetical protein